MKRSFLKIASLVICLAMLLSFAACKNELPEETTTAETSEKLATTVETDSDVTEATSTIQTEATTIEMAETTALETTMPEETTSEETTVTVTETQAETQTETKTETETETETEAETEETFPETNLELGADVEYASDFTVSKVFSSDMVIQRGEFVRVWGWADESENGKKVSATFMGYKADALIENGEWEIVFYQTHEANASLGNDLVVYVIVNDSASEEESESENESESSSEIIEYNETELMKQYVFEDILIGDVFMIIGQSNVQYNVNNYLSAEPNLKWTKDMLSEDSIIRFNYNSNTQSAGYPTRGTAEVCKDAINGYGWVKPNAGNIGELSAIGYFIAHQITELTDNGIPVGISQFSASGRPLSVFMPNELADELGSDFLDSDGIYKDNYYKDNAISRYMYNHYMYPFERMPIAGLIWYQGEAESAVQLSSVYVERFTALMEYMRSTHNILNEEFPVFYVEFPSVYKVAGSNQYLDTGRIRACTGMIPLSLSNSYIAVCSDLWDNETDNNNIHPYCKYEQAERVTDLMQAVIYGTKTMDEAVGPTLVSYELSEDMKTIVLKFANYGEGLTTSDGSNIVKGFAAVYNNKLNDKITVTATITAPDTITVTTNKVLHGVTYNCIAENFFGTDVTLCDSDGTPAHAFWIYIPVEK